ncbi:MAG: hypothetical protein ABSG43_30245, partial [Solirubrobacteraceae bacterium]
MAEVNTPLLLVGLGLMALAVTGASLSLGGVSVKGFSSVGAQVAAGAVGVLVVAASFWVGVERKASGKTAGRGGFVGAEPRRASRYVARAELVKRLVD